MIDLRKLTYGKNLSDLETQVLYYLVDHLDEVLALGVRGVASANFTSTSTIMRLAKKLGYKGFIDMYYQLVGLHGKSETHNASLEINRDFIHQFAHEMSVDEKSYAALVELASHLHQSDGLVFIYGCGFSALMAEYLAKKLLVLGLRCIYSDGADSIGVFENNLEHIDTLIAFSRSGMSHNVLNRARTAHENNISLAAFVSDKPNELASLADYVICAADDKHLDDQNMKPTLFFTRQMMLIEVLIYEYYAASIPS